MAKFVDMFDKFFDCLNVNNFTAGKHHRKPFQDPYRRATDFRLKVCNLYDMWVAFRLYFEGGLLLYCIVVGGRLPDIFGHVGRKWKGLFQERQENDVAKP